MSLLASFPAFHSLIAALEPWIASDQSYFDNDSTSTSSSSPSSQTNSPASSISHFTLPMPPLLKSDSASSSKTVKASTDTPNHHSSSQARSPLGPRSQKHSFRTTSTSNPNPITSSNPQLTSTMLSVNSQSLPSSHPELQRLTFTALHAAEEHIKSNAPPVRAKSRLVTTTEPRVASSPVVDQATTGSEGRRRKPVTSNERRLRKTPPHSRNKRNGGYYEYDEEEADGEQPADGEDSDDDSDEGHDFAQEEYWRKKVEARQRQQQQQYYHHHHYQPERPHLPARNSTGLVRDMMGQQEGVDEILQNGGGTGPGQVVETLDQVMEQVATAFPPPPLPAANPTTTTTTTAESTTTSTGTDEDDSSLDVFGTFCMICGKQTSGSIYCSNDCRSQDSSVPASPSFATMGRRSSNVSSNVDAAIAASALRLTSIKNRNRGYSTTSISAESQISGSGSASRSPSRGRSAKGDDYYITTTAPTTTAPTSGRSDLSTPASSRCHSSDSLASLKSEGKLLNFNISPEYSVGRKVKGSGGLGHRRTVSDRSSAVCSTASSSGRRKGRKSGDSVISMTESLTESTTSVTTSPSNSPFPFLPILTNPYASPTISLSTRPSQDFQPTFSNQKRPTKGEISIASPFRHRRHHSSQQLPRERQSSEATVVPETAFSSSSSSKARLAKLAMQPSSLRSQQPLPEPSKFELGPSALQHSNVVGEDKENERTPPNDSSVPPQPQSPAIRPVSPQQQHRTLVPSWLASEAGRVGNARLRDKLLLEGSGLDSEADDDDDTPVANNPLFAGGDEKKWRRASAPIGGWARLKLHENDEQRVSPVQEEGSQSSFAAFFFNSVGEDEQGLPPHDRENSYGTSRTPKASVRSRGRSVEGTRTASGPGQRERGRSQNLAQVWRRKEESNPNPKDDEIPNPRETDSPPRGRNFATLRAPVPVDFNVPSPTSVATPEESRPSSARVVPSSPFESRGRSRQRGHLQMRSRSPKGVARGRRSSPYQSGGDVSETRRSRSRRSETRGREERGRGRGRSQLASTSEDEDETQQQNDR